MTTSSHTKDALDLGGEDVRVVLVAESQATAFKNLLRPILVEQGFDVVLPHVAGDDWEWILLRQGRRARCSKGRWCPASAAAAARSVLDQTLTSLLPRFPPTDRSC